MFIFKFYSSICRENIFATTGITTWLSPSIKTIYATHLKLRQTTSYDLQKDEKVIIRLVWRKLHIPSVRKKAWLKNKRKRYRINLQTKRLVRCCSSFFLRNKLPLSCQMTINVVMSKQIVQSFSDRVQCSTKVCFEVSARGLNVNR